MSPVVRTISATQHRQWIASRPSVSFLQLPAWGQVKLGWRAESVVVDVFDWSPAQADKVIIANLFLHHFDDARLAGLLQKISRNAKLFVAVEPHRFAWPSLVGQLLWLIGCNDVTRHDAVISIRAGFAGKAISALWPDITNFQLTEHRAGLFSHVFIARRRE